MVGDSETMSEELRVRCRMDLKDLLISDFRIRKKQYLWLCGLGILMIVIPLLALPMLGPDMATYACIGGGVGVFFSLPLSSVSKYFSGFKPYGDYFVTLSSQQVIVTWTRKAPEVRYNWSNIIRIVRHSDQTLIYVTKDAAICIFDKYFDQPNESQRFLDEALSLWKQGQIEKHNQGLCET